MTRAWGFGLAMAAAGEQVFFPGEERKREAEVGCGRRLRGGSRKGRGGPRRLARPVEEEAWVRGVFASPQFEGLGRVLSLLESAVQCWKRNRCRRDPGDHPSWKRQASVTGAFARCSGHPGTCYKA